MRSNASPARYLRAPISNRARSPSSISITKDTPDGFLRFGGVAARAKGVSSGVLRPRRRVVP